MTEADIIVAVVTKIIIIENPKELVLDIGATDHIRGDRNSYYSSIVVGEQVFIDSSQTSKVIRKGKVNLKLTSGKTFALHEVLRVPHIRAPVLHMEGVYGLPTQNRFTPSFKV